MKRILILVPAVVLLSACNGGNSGRIETPEISGVSEISHEQDIIQSVTVLESEYEPEFESEPTAFILTAFSEFGAGADETMVRSYERIANWRRDYDNADEGHTFNWIKYEGDNPYILLMWDISFIGADDTIKIYKKGANDSFEHIFQTKYSNFFIDEDVEPGETYSYYMIQESRRAVNEIYDRKSDIIEIKTITESIGDNFVSDKINELWADYLNYQRHLAFNYANKYDKSNYLSGNLELRFEGEETNSEITFISYNEEIISATGEVTRPESIPVTVHYTIFYKNDKFIIRDDGTFIVAPFNNIPEEVLTLDNLEVEFDTYKDGSLRYIKGVLSDYPVFCAEDAETMLKSYAGVLGLNLNEADSKLILESVYLFNKYSGYFYFKQYYKGLKVNINSNVTFHTDLNGIVTFTSNSYLSGIDMEITPVITLEQALEIAQSVSEQIAFRGRNLGDSCGNGCPNELFIHVNNERIPMLAWSTCAFSKELNICSVIVCALTGEILHIVDVDAR
ncbi:MAG: hypothetical protein FWG70_05410 [Oscillospiraceae bacterium]|nr:hypothetical protein [Oscillospiraceae bacterium]